MPWECGDSQACAVFVGAFLFCGGGIRRDEDRKELKRSLDSCMPFSLVTVARCGAAHARLGVRMLPCAGEVGTGVIRRHVRR